MTIAPVLPERTILALRAMCLTEALDRHEDDDEKALDLAERMFDFMVAVPGGYTRGPAEAADKSEPRQPPIDPPNWSKMPGRLKDRLIEQENRVLEAFRQKIEAGERISTYAIADSLGYRRDVIRRTIKRLEADGRLIVEGPKGQPIYHVAEPEATSATESVSDAPSVLPTDQEECPLPAPDEPKPPETPPTPHIFATVATERDEAIVDAIGRITSAGRKASKGAIYEETKIGYGSIGTSLKRLREAGRVVLEGDKATAHYRLAGDQPAPPPPPPPVPTEPAQDPFEIPPEIRRQREPQQEKPKPAPAPPPPARPSLPLRPPKEEAPTPPLPGPEEIEAHVAKHGVTRLEDDEFYQAVEYLRGRGWFVENQGKRRGWVIGNRTNLAPNQIIAEAREVGFGHETEPNPPEPEPVKPRDPLKVSSRHLVCIRPGCRNPCQPGHATCAECQRAERQRKREKGGRG